jgi:hypothetical protein
VARILGVHVVAMAGFTHIGMGVRLRRRGFDRQTDSFRCRRPCRAARMWFGRRLRLMQARS